MNSEDEINIIGMPSMMEEFVDSYMLFHKNNLERYNELNGNKGAKKIFEKQYNYLTKGKFSLIRDLLNYEEFKKFKENNDFKKYLYRNCFVKIKGIFKHGQCAKTEISCTKIIMDMKRGFITIAITKNTLLANKQWTTRCITLMKKHGLKNLRKEIIVISSEFNDLDGNATHCKNLLEAWDKICDSSNTYKVIFVCANKTRVDDVCELLNKYNQPAFNVNMRKQIVIQWDEAHNDMYGVPVYRHCVENMLLYNFVEEFIPISASHTPIHDDENPIWTKNNMYANKLNYINDDLAKTRIISTDSNYSCIEDAYNIVIENNEVYSFTNDEYDNSISKEMFTKHYPNKNYDKLGYINACPEFLCGNEHIALNTGKKILDNPNISYEKSDNDEIVISTEKIYKKNVGNYHIMITPCRTVISELLMKHAVFKDYDPVVIGIYGGSINYMYRDYSDGKVKSSIPGKGIQTTSDKSKEFNENLNLWLRKKNLLNRCVIIFGNYQAVGESNTFVNSDYGYIRSISLLPGCNLNPEKHYQYLLRCCFILDKFTGLTKNTVEKFIISYKKGIDDALEYELLNDEIVQDLINNPNDSELFDYVSSGDQTANSSANTNNIYYSIPIQFKIEDDSCEQVKIIKKIMDKDSRNQTDKNDFMTALISAIENSTIIKNDKNTNPKIVIENYRLTEFRCYKESYNPESYRFKGYYDNWFAGFSYKNGEIQENECGVYCCLKQHKSTDGHINNPNTFYILFAYKK